MKIFRTLSKLFRIVDDCQNLSDFVQSLIGQLFSANYQALFVTKTYSKRCVMSGRVCSILNKFNSVLGPLDSQNEFFELLFCYIVKCL